MDIHQLELFLAVLDASSMTRAAEKFYLSPAAVSFQMHNLALELNTELFVREGKKVNPTPAALRLAELGLVLKHKNRARVHSFRNPLF